MSNHAEIDQIFKALFSAGIDVVEFSVPKAGLLEDLYLNFMDESNEKGTENLQIREIETKQKGETTV